MSLPLRAAILDLYNNTPNEGMRCIREMLDRGADLLDGRAIAYDVFDVRAKGEVPDLSYDLYISTGGPGSPFDGEGQDWEAAYFGWLDAVWQHNLAAPAEERKHVLFICHSFQMMVRFFGVAEVTARHSESFGIFAIHQTPAGLADPLFEGLANPFYAADFRHWQAVQPNQARLQELGASVLALEKERPHVPYERALMAIRLSPEMVGVQFHPEADPVGMHLHFRQPKRRAYIIEHHSEEKYLRILNRLTDPNYIERTHQTLIPNFIRNAALVPAEAL